jgi:hypothetical protein
MIPNEIFLNGGDKYKTGAHNHILNVLKCFDQKKYRFFMLNWARRHRKTTMILNLLIKECMKHKNSIYTYVAPTYNQAKKIIWQDPDMLNTYLPIEYVKRKSTQDLLIEFVNGSLLRILGGDDPDKLRGINTIGIVFDEWSVFAHPKTIWQEIFQPILRQDINRWAMFIFTPKGQNECYKMWCDAQNNPEWFTSELKASTAKIIPIEEYRKAKRETDPLLFAQEYECAFIAEEEMTFITSVMIESVKLIIPKYPFIKKLVSIDPALGGDECVIYYMENFKVKKQLIGHWQDSKVIAAEAAVIANEFKCKNICVDYIGLGEGIYSRLNEMNFNTIAVDVRNKSVDPACFNLKASIWWICRKLFLDKKIPYPEDLELRRQLSSVKFEFKNGLIAAEDKSKTKKRVGHSPDRGECYTQGIYTMVELEAEKVVDSYDFDNNNIEEEYIEHACM